MGGHGNITGTDSPAVKQLVQRAASDWLTLRRPADHVARTPTLPVLAHMAQHLSSMLPHSEEVPVMDLGAGTGSNLEWLAPRLAVRQGWTLIDRDEELLALISEPTGSSGVRVVSRLATELDELGSLHHDAGPMLITCSALLDVLIPNQIKTLCRFIVARQATALFSLTVTGEVEISPVMDLDTRIDEAFNTHQERHGLAGPGATATAEHVLRAAGFDVHIIATPWELGTGCAELIERYLIERVDAALEHDPTLTIEAKAWLAARLTQLRHGSLSIRVGHQDLVALPPTQRCRP